MAETTPKAPATQAPVTPAPQSAIEANNDNLNKDNNFQFASALIKVIAVVIALMVLVMSRFAFIFFSAAMLPTIFAIFFDRNEHKCLSATICSFNLIGVIPYLMKIWNSNSIDHASKYILSDINSWMVIYGAAFAGQLLYGVLPILFVKIYSARIQLQVGKYEEEYKAICKDWDIDNYDVNKG